MLQSTDANNPAILTAPEGSDFILSVTGTRVGLLHLSFQDTAPASAALQLDQVSDVDVRFAHFLNLEGDAIRVTDATEVWIADSEFRDVGGVSVTLGCEEAVCAVPNARITDLLIDGSERGVWVHEGSSASIEEGVFANLGQEALAYGGDLGRVGGNLFWAPVIVGGAAQVHNNIFVSGLTVDTEAVGAELLGNAILGGLTVTRTPTTWTILGNAVEGEAWAEGNVACAVPSDCWEDAEGGDFRPVSALLEPGVDSGLLTDFCGSTRVSPHAMGALERTETGAPLGVQFKKLQICTVPDFVPQDPEPRTRRRTSAKSCGCEVTPTPAMLSGLFVFGVALVGVRIK
jgi:hypothetical protein